MLTAFFYIFSAFSLIDNRLLFILEEMFVCCRAVSVVVSSSLAGRKRSDLGHSSIAILKYLVVTDVTALSEERDVVLVPCWVLLWFGKFLSCWRR